MHFLQILREANITRDKEWNTGSKPLSLVFFANELGGEVGETCNVLKKLDREFNYQVKGSRDTFEHLAEEMADIIICCDLLGMSANLTFSEFVWTNADKEQGHPDYSKHGAFLLSIVGRINGIALYYDTHTNNLQLRSVVHDLIRVTKIYADQLGIDLEKSIADKFNATSRKLNLKTMLALPIPDAPMDSARGTGG